MFAASAGAKQVIGIDMSNILDQAQKIIEANGFKDSEWAGAGDWGWREADAALRRDHPHQGQA